MPLARLLLVALAIASAASSLRAGARPAVEYIDCTFENASPLWYDLGDDGIMRVHLLYDHERGIPNRAAGHIHFKVEARPGTKLTIEFNNLENIYNGKPGSVA